MGIQDELAKDRNRGNRRFGTLNKIIKNFSRECKNDVAEKIMAPKNPSPESWAIVNAQYRNTMKYFIDRYVSLPMNKQNSDEAARSIAQLCLQLRTLAENQPAAKDAPGAPAALAAKAPPADAPTPPAGN